MQMNPVLCMSRAAIKKQCTVHRGMAAYKFKFSEVESKHLHLINRSVVDGTELLQTSIGTELPQVLPYVVVQCGNEYLTYSRAKGAEDRLHGKLSMGLGGHVEMEDLAANNVTLATGLLRELQEEIGLDLELPFHLTDKETILIDTTNSVGRVHVGILHLLEVDDKALIKPDPSEIHLPEWKTKHELLANIGSYENWSQIIISLIDNGILQYLHTK